MMEGRFPYAGLGLMTPSLLLGLHGVPLPLALLGTWSRPLCVIRSTLATIGLGRHFFFFFFFLLLSFYIFAKPLPLWLLRCATAENGMVSA